MDRTLELEKLKSKLLEDSDLPLFDFRKANGYLPVLGEGNADAKIMFIGEAPGKNEAQTGHPFQGAAGKILNELLEHIGLKRESVYITNIVNDRPPENRDPLPEEILAYTPYLDRQIDIIKPRVIVGLGRFAAKYILEKFGVPEATKMISSLHGRAFSAETVHGELKLVALYHPAAAIYNAKQKDILKNDFEILKKLI